MLYNIGGNEPVAFLNQSLGKLTGSDSFARFPHETRTRRKTNFSYQGRFWAAGPRLRSSGIALFYPGGGSRSFSPGSPCRPENSETKATSWQKQDETGKGQLSSQIKHGLVGRHFYKDSISNQ